jgi:DNA-binding NarL/FixJ family response regulator
MTLASAREKGPNPGDAAPADAVEGIVLSVLVLGGDAAERGRLSTLIGATRGLSCYDDTRVPGGGGGASGPDVVLLALDPRRLDADAVLHDAVERWKPAPVLVLSGSVDDDANRNLVRKGARGAMRRSREAEHLGIAIRKVSDGEIWLSRGCLSLLIDDLAATGQRPPPQADRAFASLTEREREVAAHIAEGMHNRAIAATLGITENTVRHHLTAIYGKLGVADRLELAVFALRHRDGGQRRK